MANKTIDKKTAARGRRVLAAIVLVAIMAAGAVAFSRNNDGTPQDPTPVTASEAGAMLSNDKAWARIAGAPPMSALNYAHSR